MYDTAGGPDGFTRQARQHCFTAFLIRVRWENYMSTAKKIGRFISSMQFAIFLLLLLTAACAFGSFITQGQSYEWYAAQYSERTAGAILALQLDDVFHSWWFVAITMFLCLNLLACNLVRLPALLRRFGEVSDPARYVETEGGARLTASHTVAEDRIPEIMHRMGIRSTSEGVTRNGYSFRFGCRNSIGIWGAWVCHLGIMLTIAGFGFGQMAKQTWDVYGVPGQSRAIGETGYILTIDSFDIGLREDDSVEQYTAGITVRDAARGESQSATISVNHPADMFGMRFYQNATGWAANIRVEENGQPLQEEVVCAGDYLRVADKQDLVISLNAFYPDYVLDPANGPMTLSSQIRNPAYLYSVYYQGQMLGMNALLESEKLTIDEYTVTFGDPQNYTLIQIKKDPFTLLALIGGGIVMAGLILAFYLQQAAVWMVQKDDELWEVHGQSPKGGVLFAQQLETAIRESGKSQL